MRQGTMLILLRKRCSLRSFLYLLMFTSCVFGFVSYSALKSSHFDYIRNIAYSPKIFLKETSENENQATEVETPTSNPQLFNEVTDHRLKFSAPSDTLTTQGSHNISRSGTVAYDVNASLPRKHSFVKTFGRKPIRIYIYELTSEFNSDIINCIQHVNSSFKTEHCTDYSNDGMGKFLFKDDEMSVHSTHQYSLDVILHHQLLNSKYRTDNASEADVFYVPAYLGLYKYCDSHNVTLSKLVNILFDFLNEMPYFQDRKPHVVTMTSSEQENTKTILSHPDWKRMIQVIPEKASAKYRKKFNISDNKVIVAPYPSHIHLNYSTEDSSDVSLLYPPDRNVFLFWATHMHRKMSMGGLLVNEFPLKTEDTYSDFIQNMPNDTQEQVLLITWDCSDHYNKAIQWMKHSVFCLHVVGDVPKFKAIYDSIVCGCIPVVLELPKQSFEFPFEKLLNYNKFMVRHQLSLSGEVDENILILSYLKDISDYSIMKLHRHLREVMYLFQYPLISKEQEAKKESAVDMIVGEIAEMGNQ